jgi:nitrogen regulatory protein PII
MPKSVLKFVVFVVEWGSLSRLSRVLEKMGLRHFWTCKGMGTASSEILDLLGLGSTEKAVVLALAPKGAIVSLLEQARRTLGRQGAGAGIAFTVPVSAISGPALTALTEGVQSMATDVQQTLGCDNGQTAGQAVVRPAGNDLIISVINHGYSDDFMTAARQAGARGGTIINARGTANKGGLKFLGVTVQDERELILIVASCEQKAAIMSALGKGFGLSSKANGFIFSLPVDTLMSLNLID